MRRVTVIVRRAKWRPRLGLVVLAILIIVMALPLVGLFFFRLYENQLIRQTEAELIAQGAALAAIYAGEVRDAAFRPKSSARWRPQSTAPPQRSTALDEPYRPIEPPSTSPSTACSPTAAGCRAGDADPAFAAIGARLARMLADTQMTTLAGFRLLDPARRRHRRPRGGRPSLGDVEEVREALAGTLCQRAARCASPSGRRRRSIR